MFKYKHHNTSFLISTSDIINQSLRAKVNDAILDVFKGFLQSSSDSISLEFQFTDNIDKFIVDSNFMRIKNVKVGNTQTHFIDHELNFLITNSNPFNIIVSIVDNESFISSLRIFNKAFKNNIERQVAVFYYRLFLLFSQLWNVNKGISYLHSSAVSLYGKSIVFTADSGVGKSSLLVKLSAQDEFSFIADDLTIISSDSIAFYQGRSLSIKPYHLNFFPILEKKINCLMSGAQKLQWRFLRDIRLTYRISPSDLFERTSESAEIKRIIHLCHHTGSNFKISNLSSTDLVRYTTSILINELFLANQKLNILASLPNSLFLNSSMLYDKVNEIYSNSFKDVEIKLVLVPYMSDPNDLYEFLKSEGCLS